jgi:predicted nucleic acid-binding Zn ribbon protein
LKVHEDCGGEVEKLISHSAFQLKGSGWYQTDYAKGAKTTPPVKGEGKQESGAAESKASDGSSESKSDSKSESKSEAKTEAKPAVTTTKSD